MKRNKIVRIELTIILSANVAAIVGSSANINGLN